MLASVCICTFNRAAGLRSLLALLAERQIASTEIVVIDNASTDDTQVMVRGDFPLVRYVFEGQQGLSHARNRAIAESVGDVLVFADDDIIPSYDWLAAYVRAAENYPAAGFFGGRILSRWPHDKTPGWARHPLPLLDGALVHYDLGTENRWLHRSDMLPFGASFAVRRSRLDEVGGFRTDLGVRGNQPGLGEETELLQRVRRIADGVYVGEAVCQHPVHLKRMTLAGLFRYGVASGISHNATSDRPQIGSKRGSVFFLGKAAAQFMRGRGNLARQCIINAGIQRGLTASPSPNRS